MLTLTVLASSLFKDSPRTPWAHSLNVSRYSCLWYITEIANLRFSPAKVNLMYSAGPTGLFFNGPCAIFDSWCTLELFCWALNTYISETRRKVRWGCIGRPFSLFKQELTHWSAHQAVIYVEKGPKRSLLNFPSLKVYGSKILKFQRNIDFWNSSLFCLVLISC